MEGEHSIWDVGKWNGRIWRASRAVRWSIENGLLQMVVCHWLLRCG